MRVVSVLRTIDRTENIEYAVDTEYAVFGPQLSWAGVVCLRYEMFGSLSSAAIMLSVTVCSPARRAPCSFMLDIVRCRFLWTSPCAKTAPGANTRFGTARGLPLCGTQPLPWHHVSGSSGLHTLWSILAAVVAGAAICLQIAFKARVAKGTAGDL